MPPKRKSAKEQALPASKRANTRLSAQEADSVSKAVNEVIDIDSLPKAKEKLKTQFYLGEFPENTGLNGFPCFSSGDVFIILDPRNPKYQYRLHRNILESFSSVFRRTLKEQVNEASQQMKIDAAGERALRYAFDYSLSPLRLKREAFTIKLPQNRPGERSTSGPGAPSTIPSPSDMRNASFATTDLKIYSIVENKTDSEEPFICAQEHNVKAIPAPLNGTFGIGKDTLSISDGDSSPVNQNEVGQQMQFDFNRRAPPPFFTNTATETLNTSIPLPKDQCIRPEIDTEIKAEDILMAEADIQQNLKEEAKIETKPEIDIKIKAEEILMTEADIQQKLKEVETEIVSKKAATAQILTKQAHHSLFLIFYGKQPIISLTDIQQALRQSENIISVARAYDALRVAIPHISNSLMQHGRSVYHAIAREPLRWLHISVALENAVIFNEAMIHVVGTLSHSAVSQAMSRFDENVISLVRSKVNELDRNIARVNEVLFCCSIDEDGIRVKLDAVGKTSFDVWCVVQLWRSWFGDNLAECRIPSRHPSEPNTAAKLGIFYRTIAVGGDAYLPCNEIRTILRQLNIIQSSAEVSDTPGFMQLESVDSDLSLMKDYAKAVVQDICHNMSMIDHTAAGIDYLTCTQVEPHELPWVDAFNN